MNIGNSSRIKSTVITYEPDNSIKKGYRSLIREIWQEIYSSRWLIFQLFKRELFAKYKQSFSGILWTLFIPLSTIGTLILLNRSGIFLIGNIGVPYPIYAILGMAFWQIFSAGVTAASNSLVEAGPMIVKINFSKKSLVIASVGQSIVSFLIYIVLAVILFASYGITPNKAVLLVPFVIIPIILFTIGLGFILSLLNGITRDVGNALSMLMTFMMFLTPFLYSRPDEGILAIVTDYNPLYYFVTVPRDLVLTGMTSEWMGFSVSCVLSILVFMVFLLIFHLTETRVAERV